MHLFLSPHLDDAALSCGGIIHHLTQSGQPVAVMTLMAGHAPTTLPESPLIRTIHARWGVGDEPFAARRAEDRAALGQLGISNIWVGDWHDCIYRTNARGQALYVTDDHIFGQIHPDDPLGHAAIDLAPWPNITHLYAPLGAGNHVDHQLVRAMALKTQTVALFLYEEYPYSSEAGEVFHAHAGEEMRLSGATAVHTALASLPATPTLQIHPISEVALRAKIDAISCYHSQISTFWNDCDEMIQSVRNHALQAGGNNYGERLWILEI